MGKTYSQQMPIAYLITEVGKQLRRRFEDEAKAHEITLPQWRTLAELSRHDGIAQVALATRTDMDPMTMSGVLDRLEKRGLVERYPDPRDSRAKLARLQPEGRDLVEQASRVALDIYRRSIEGLDEAQRLALTGALERIRDNLVGMDADQKESA